MVVLYPINQDLKHHCTHAKPKLWEKQRDAEHFSGEKSDFIETVGT